MDITIEQLFNGKGTKIKGKEYYSAEQYVTPFLERMQKYTNDFRVQAVPPSQISLTPNGEMNLDDIVWNRVYIQAVLPNDIGFDNHVQVIGMVYGLDTRKPISKIFNSGLNCACTNLCVFNPSDLVVQDIEPETPIDYRCIDFMMSEVLDVANWLKKLNNIEVVYNEQTINQNLGKWIRNTISCSYNSANNKVKLATSAAIDAYKYLYEKEDSDYYVPVGNTTNLFNVYNAFTQTLTDDSRDIINKCEKCLLLKQILEIN